MISKEELMDAFTELTDSDWAEIEMRRTVKSSIEYNDLYQNERLLFMENYINQKLEFASMDLIKEEDNSESIITKIDFIVNTNLVKLKEYMGSEEEVLSNISVMKAIIRSKDNPRNESIISLYRLILDYDII